MVLVLFALCLGLVAAIICYCCVVWTLSTTVVTLFGISELVALLVVGLCTVCHGLFALPLGVIGRLCSVVKRTATELIHEKLRQKFSF